MKIKEKIKNGKDKVCNWFDDNFEFIYPSVGILAAGIGCFVLGVVAAENAQLTKQLVMRTRQEGCDAVEEYVRKCVPEAAELIDKDLESRKMTLEL